MANDKPTIGSLHAHILKMRQESALRQEHHAERGSFHFYSVEQCVGAELDRVLRLFKEATDEDQSS
jgi:hypothetical protein